MDIILYSEKVNTCDTYTYSIIYNMEKQCIRLHFWVLYCRFDEKVCEKQLNGREEIFLISYYSIYFLDLPLGSPSSIPRKKLRKISKDR